MLIVLLAVLATATPQARLVARPDGGTVLNDWPESHAAALRMADEHCRPSSRHAVIQSLDTLRHVLVFACVKEADLAEVLGSLLRRPGNDIKR